jgi:hypothetical protein
LSARLGDLVLTDKEVSGIVIKDVGSVPIPKPKWVAVGKACTPRKIVIGALERARHACTQRKIVMYAKEDRHVGQGYRGKQIRHSL